MFETSILYALPKSETPEEVKLIFNGAKVTLHFENTIENLFVFQRIEEILLAASELK